jgi:hypothetical protein
VVTATASWVDRNNGRRARSHAAVRICQTLTPVSFAGRVSASEWSANWNRSRPAGGARAGESDQTTVVHVWRRTADFAQCRCLEVALSSADIHEFSVAPGDACIVQTLVGEVGTDMAGDAVGLTTVYTVAALSDHNPFGSLAVTTKWYEPGARLR